MFNRNRGAATTMVARVGSVSSYVNPLITDARLRKRIVAARSARIHAKKQSQIGRAHV